MTDKLIVTIESKLLKPYKSAVLTITADNGVEFSHHKAITKALGAQCIFVILTGHASEVSMKIRTDY